jgi:drug/metabolite transporter (DMT)-like permease
MVAMSTSPFTGMTPFSRADSSPSHEASRCERHVVMTDVATPDLRAPARTDGLALAAALVTVALWASAFVGIRDAGAEIAAGPLSLGRLLVGSALLGALVAHRREALPPRRDLPRLALFGLLWFAVYNVVLNTAERRVDAGTAAMLVNIGPIFIAMLAGLLLREGFPRTLLAGCAIAFAGAIVIGLATSERSVDAGWGAGLCIAAAAAYVAGVVAQKPLLERTSALQVTFLGCAVGAIACLPYAPALVRDVHAASAPAVAWTAYLGLFPTAIGFTTWAYALRRTTAGRMGATLYLVPPLAVVMGWIVLGETPPALALAGGALCLAGVVVARGAGALRRRAQREPGG